MDLQALCLPLKARSFEIEGSDIPGLRILGISGAEGFAFFFVWLGSVFFFVWLGSAGLWRKVFFFFVWLGSALFFVWLGSVGLGEGGGFFCGSCFFFLRLAWLGSFLRLAWLGRAWRGRRAFFVSSSGLARLCVYLAVFYSLRLAWLRHFSSIGLAPSGSAGPTRRMFFPFIIYVRHSPVTWRLDLITYVQHTPACGASGSPYILNTPPPSCVDSGSSYILIRPPQLTTPIHLIS